MKTKFFLFASLATTIVLLILNGLFHGVAAAGFFDTQNAPLGDAVLKMADFRPGPVVLLEFILIFALAAILIRWRNEPVSPREGLQVGGLFYLGTSATWNLANTATFAHWSAAVTVADIAWHTVTGLLAGWMIARIFNLQFKATI